MNEQKTINKEIKIAIIKVIVYFDLFDYPLTEFEIWKYLSKKASLFEIMNILNKSQLSTINRRNGFYFLTGRDEIVKTRMRRNDFACDKFKKANRITRIFRRISPIKMIAMSNMMGALNSKKNSDIDLFILVEEGKIWRTRFLCVMIVKLLNLRPREGDKKDKICLSFFMCINYLNTEKLRIKDDIYFNYWMVNIVPIYNIDFSYEKFISNNKWIKKEFPNWKMVKSGHRFFTNSKKNLFISFLVLSIFSLGEKFFKKIQLRKFSDSIKSGINKNSNIVIGDDILKLHTKDGREMYKEEYVKKMYEIFK